MRFAAPALLLACVLAAIGCGSQDDATPVACLEGASAYAQALQDAPAEVRLGGETPISDCLAENQKAGDLAQAGEAMVEVATKLNAQARANPDTNAALQLGYLLGAAQRGAARSEGIHSDLVRRLVVAARYAPDGEPLPPGFFAHYQEGFKAGRFSG
jgi:hypothetical protein